MRMPRATTRKAAEIRLSLRGGTLAGLLDGCRRSGCGGDMLARLGVIALVTLMVGAALGPTAYAYDVNGDGLDDVFVPRGDYGTRAVVVLGGFESGPVSGGAPGGRGFVVRTPVSIE